MAMAKEVFDAIVIGGGHAGIEAARALCTMGQRVALVTLDPQKIGAMSCNPAIGGVAKSHLVYEIDAMGGLMGFAADQSGIQSRRLNMNKGPAVRSTRTQCDKSLYSKTMRKAVGELELLKVINGEVGKILHQNQGVSGVELGDGSTISARAVLVTAGTFMHGLMFCGAERQVGGRFGDKASDTLSLSIKNIGHRVKRLKTGTPARLRSQSINFSKLQKQWGDAERRPFSWRDDGARLPQLCCYLTHTNAKTHEIIRKNFHQSPLFSGDIEGIGPRYCPSVEDKVRRFTDRDRHQIFLEPEGLSTNSIYPNGLSTSLPAEVQLDFLRSIEGLEGVELLRPGYAVEYDSIDPTQLHSSLMSKFAEGLFFAGQVNRSSGYEEAAAQGLWAGINAALYLRGEAGLKPDRSRSYMETLVSDLTTLGTEEPYRMFTSRSEYRLLLREDNAFERMQDISSRLDLLSKEQLEWQSKLSCEVSTLREHLKTTKVRLSSDRVISYHEYLRRPEISWEQIGFLGDLRASSLAYEMIEVETKYAGYIEKQVSERRELQKIRNWNLDPSFDVAKLAGLSSEVIEKYLHVKPKNVEELLSISGITPAAALLLARKAAISSTAYTDRVLL